MAPPYSLQRKPKLKLLWVTDPWDTLDHPQDTTLRLAQEALNLGLVSYWSGSDIILKSTSSHFTVIPMTTELIKNFNALPLVSSELMEPSKLHHIHYRVDPPVDFKYISLVEKILEKGAKESQILNPPALITRQSEKVPPKNLQHLTPLLRVIKNVKESTEAFQVFKTHSQFVSKPMNLAQSQGVKKWGMPKTEAEFVKILFTETHDFAEPILVEEYLPDVMKGEVRMWFANGEFIAALKKFPKSGDFRVLIDEGSKVEPYSLTAEESKSAHEVGKVLKTQGAAFAAIDFISGKISDYNITSPGLLNRLEEVHGGKNFAKVMLEKIYFSAT